jgi:alpha-methylacyl-CoA racemase
MHTDDRGTNLFDGGAPFYDVYECGDGGFLSVAPIEPHFYAQLLDGLGLEATELPDQYDQARWPELRAAIAAAIAQRPRDEWVDRFAGTDACVAPVLSFTEALSDGHNRARGVLRTEDGTELVPVPRLSAAPGPPSSSPAGPGADTGEVLREAGFTDQEIAGLVAAGAVAGG